MKLFALNAHQYMHFSIKENALIVMMMKLQGMDVKNVHMMKKIKNIYAMDVGMITILTLITLISVYLI